MHGPVLAVYALLWATLLRALLVRARILPPTCTRCGLPLERRTLGDRICAGAHEH